MDLFILKTDGEKFTSTNEKTLHLIFKLTAKTTLQALHTSSTVDIISVLIYSKSGQSAYEITSINLSQIRSLQKVKVVTFKQHLLDSF